MTITPESQETLMEIVIVGGGPTGVELAGALSEMKRHIIPKDYPDLDSKKMQIHLIQSTGKLLDGMSDKASAKAYSNLKAMGVNIHLNTTVKDLNENLVSLSNGTVLKTRKIIWAAGVRGSEIVGLHPACYDKNGRIIVNCETEIPAYPRMFAIGDISLMASEKYPRGLPGLAPVALQQSNYLAKKLLAENKNKKIKPFHYIDKGTMATIGRSKAVLDFHGVFLSGFFAWISWLFVHIYYLIGVRNKIIVFINWLWSYLFYDQALRLNIRPKPARIINKQT
jgi:NADH dehydrogenase